MKKYFIQTIIIILALLVINGCSNQTNNSKIIHTGTKGLVIEKLPGTPTTIYEGESFSLGVFLKNQGSEDITRGILRVNFDDYFMELNKIDSKEGISKEVKLKGKSIENPAGDSDYLEYVFNSKPLGVIRDSVNVKINFNTCYDYKTDLTTEVCIDTRSRTSDQRTFACKAKTFTSNTGQGAPIAITKIETELIRVSSNNMIKPVFRIYIKNTGKGYTLTPEPSLCDNPTINTDKINKLKIKAWISSNIELTCNPEIVRINSGETIARCSVKDEDLNNLRVKTTNYITILRVLLEYNYVDTEEFNLKIKRVEEFEIKPQNICGFYEIEQNGECVSLCDYCVKNPSASECMKNINPDIFKWSDASDFSCACTKEKCLTLSKDGKCVFGYCPGSSYCCSSDECRDKPDGSQCGENYVCINNKCSNQTKCEYNFGAQNYSCNNINNCINNTIKRGFCPGDTKIVCCKTG